MSIFDDFRAGKTIDIRNSEYQKEVHGEIDWCNDLCYQINATLPSQRDKIVALENELLADQMHDGTFFSHHQCTLIVAVKSISERTSMPTTI